MYFLSLPFCRQFIATVKKELIAHYQKHIIRYTLIHSIFPVSFWASRPLALIGFSIWYYLVPLCLSWFCKCKYFVCFVFLSCVLSLSYSFGPTVDCIDLTCLQAYRWTLEIKTFKSANRSPPASWRLLLTSDCRHMGYPSGRITPSTPLETVIDFLQFHFVSCLL